MSKPGLITWGGLMVRLNKARNSIKIFSLVGCFFGDSIVWQLESDNNKLGCLGAKDYLSGGQKNTCNFFIVK